MMDHFRRLTRLMVWLGYGLSHAPQLQAATQPIAQFCP